MSVLSDLQRSAELNRRAFAACRRALTMAEQGLSIHANADDILRAESAIKAARTSMRKAEKTEAT